MNADRLIKARMLYLENSNRYLESRVEQLEEELAKYKKLLLKWVSVFSKEGTADESV